MATFIAHEEETCIARRHLIAGIASVLGPFAEPVRFLSQLHMSAGERRMLIPASLIFQFETGDPPLRHPYETLGLWALSEDDFL